MEFPFTANTQAEFDAAVQARLAREAKKYEGFEGYKAKAAELETLLAQNYPGQIEKLTQDLQGLKDKLAQAETDSKTKADTDKALIDELTQKLGAAELTNLKAKVALDVGLPYEIAGRLHGQTEEELMEDAKVMAGYFSGVQTQPLGGNEPAPSGGVNYFDLLNNTQPTVQEEYAAFAKLADDILI